MPISYAMYIHRNFVYMFFYHKREVVSVSSRNIYPFYFWHDLLYDILSESKSFSIPYVMSSKYLLAFSHAQRTQSNYPSELHNIAVYYLCTYIQSDCIYRRGTANNKCIHIYMQWFSNMHTLYGIPIFIRPIGPTYIWTDFNINQTDWEYIWELPYSRILVYSIFPYYVVNVSGYILGTTYHKQIRLCDQNLDFVHILVVKCIVTHTQLHWGDIWFIFRSTEIRNTHY